MDIWILQDIWKSHSMPISTKIQLIKRQVWPEATYGCESRDERTAKDSVGFMDSKENK